MRRIAVFSLLMLSLFICRVTTAEERSPLAFAREVSEAPVIDGILNEQCWQEAPEADSFVTIYDNSKLADPRTWFKVVYDRERLYFGIRGEEPDTSKLILEKAGRDVWPKGDSLEIFLDTRRDRSTYFQFAAGLSGGRYDGYMQDKTWNAEWDAAARIGKDAWSMEIVIKFSSLGVSMPPKGSTWGLNICRNRRGEQRYSSSWAAVGSHFHNPGKFNDLVFGSARDWWVRESAGLKDESEELHEILGRFDPKEEGLEQRLASADRLREELSSQLDQILPMKIADFLPLYYRMQSLKRRYQEITEEIEVVSALERAGK